MPCAGTSPQSLADVPERQRVLNCSLRVVHPSEPIGMALVLLQAAAMSAMVVSISLPPSSASFSLLRSNHVLASHNDTSSFSSLRHTRSLPLALHTRVLPPSPSSLLYFAPSLTSFELRDVLPASTGRESRKRRADSLGKASRPPNRNRPGSSSLRRKSPARSPDAPLRRGRSKKPSSQRSLTSSSSTTVSLTKNPSSKSLTHRAKLKPPHSPAHTSQANKAFSRYRFEYGMDNNNERKGFGHTESGDVEAKKGEYFVRLPDGRTQTVIYNANASGYFARVIYTESDESKRVSQKYKVPNTKSPAKNIGSSSAKVATASRPKSKGSPKKPPQYTDETKRGKSPTKAFYKPAYLQTKIRVRSKAYQEPSSSFHSLARAPTPPPLSSPYVPLPHYQRPLSPSPYISSYGPGERVLPIPSFSSRDHSSLSYSQGHIASSPNIPPYGARIPHFSSPPLLPPTPTPRPPPLPYLPPNPYPSYPKHPYPLPYAPPYVYTPNPLSPLRSYTTPHPPHKKSHSKTYKPPSLNLPKESYVTPPTQRKPNVSPSHPKKSYTSALPPSSKTPSISSKNRRPPSKSYAAPQTKKSSSPPRTTKKSYTTTYRPLPPPPSKAPTTLPPRKSYTPPSFPPTKKSYTSTLQPPSSKPHPRKPHILPSPPDSESSAPCHFSPSMGVPTRPPPPPASKYLPPPVSSPVTYLPPPALPHVPTPPPVYVTTPPPLYVSTPPPVYISTTPPPLYVTAPPSLHVSTPRPLHALSPSQRISLPPPPPLPLRKPAASHRDALDTSVVAPIVPVIIPVDNRDQPVVSKEKLSFSRSVTTHRNEASSRRHDSRVYDEDDDLILQELKEYDEAANDYL